MGAMLRRKHLVVLVDMETGAQTPHARRSTQEGAEKLAARLNRRFETHRGDLRFIVQEAGR